MSIERPCRASPGRGVPGFIDGHADRTGDGNESPPSVPVPVPANDTGLPVAPHPPAANDNEPVAAAP